jgi:S1-C subfamily serine protease
MAGTVFVATRHESPAIRPAASAPRTAGLAQTRSIPWSTPSPPLSLKDLSMLVAPARVEVRCRDRQSTGFFVARDVVLTRAAATDGCAAVEVAAGGATLEGEVMQREPWLGLALVRASGSGIEPLRLGDAASLHGGDRIFIAGSTLREGRMGMAARQLHGIAYLVMTGDVQPGDAGAPVLDGDGYVMGLVAAREETGGEPSFLPINYAYAESHLLETPAGTDVRSWKALLAEVETAEKLRVEPSPDSGAATPQSPSIQ